MTGLGKDPVTGRCDRKVGKCDRENMTPRALLSRAENLTSLEVVKGFNLKTHQQLEKKFSSPKKWRQIYHRGGPVGPPPVLIGLTFTVFALSKE